MAARPLRCGNGLLVGRSTSERPPPGVLRWSFARKHRLGHVSEQCVGRLSHDRTTVRRWQRLGSHRKYVPRSQHTCGSPRHISLGSRCAIILSPFHSWSSTRLGRRTLAGSTPVPYGARRGTFGYPRRCSNGVGVLNDWGWSDPGTLLGVPSPPLSVSARCWPSAGSSRGWPACCRQVTPGEPGGEATSIQLLVEPERSIFIQDCGSEMRARDTMN